MFLFLANTRLLCSEASKCSFIKYHFFELNYISHPKSVGKHNTCLTMLVVDETEVSEEHFQRDYEDMTMEELRIELQTANDRIHELSNQQEITDLFPQIESLQTEVNFLTEENTRLVGQLRQQEKEDIITESYIEKDEAPPDLPGGRENEQIKVLQEELISLQLELKTAKETNEDVQATLDKERSNLDTEKTKRQMNVNEAAVAEKEAQQLKEENEKLEKELSEQKEGQKRTKNEARRKSASLEEELRRAQQRAEKLDADQNNASEGLNAVLIQERAKHEKVAGKLKDNTAALNSVKETLEKVTQENVKLKQNIVEAQTTMDTMVSQADLGIKSQKAQKKLKEQVASLTSALQQAEDEKIKNRKEFIRKQQKTDEIVGQHSRWQEKEKIYLADIKKLKNEIRQLKETLKTTDNSFLKAKVEELTISNGVLKEMVRSANINVRVAIAKGKTHRTESESTLHNQTKCIAMKQTPTKRVFQKSESNAPPSSTRSDNLPLESPQQRIDVIRDRDQKLWSPNEKMSTPVRSNENEKVKENESFALPPASPTQPLPPSAPTSPKESERSVARKDSNLKGNSMPPIPTSPISQRGNQSSSDSGGNTSESFSPQLASPSSRKATDGGKTPQMLESEPSSSLEGSAHSPSTSSRDRNDSRGGEAVASTNQTTSSTSRVDEAEEGSSDESDYCDDISVPSPRRISAVDVVDDDYDVDEPSAESPKSVKQNISSNTESKNSGQSRNTQKKVGNSSNRQSSSVRSQKMPTRRRSSSIHRRTSHPKRKSSKQRS